MLHQPSSALCLICNKEIALSEMFPVVMLSSPLKEKLQREHPILDVGNQVCVSDIRHYQACLMGEYLQKEVGTLTPHDQAVLESLESDRLTTRNLNHQNNTRLKLGQQIADQLSIIAGSWGFILSFLFFLFSWMLINSWQLLQHPFDPYPYILLNLVLSCLAALQAPVILMSQNRQAQRDRIEAENDYHINMISELQLRLLHEKLDILLKAQWEQSLKDPKEEMGTTK